MNQNLADKTSPKAHEFDPVEHLQRMADKYDSVLIKNNGDGTFDVRAGGTATYARTLRSALSLRMRMEMTQEVTAALEGAVDTGGGIGSGLSGAAAPLVSARR